MASGGGSGRGRRGCEIEACGLIIDKFGLSGGAWDGISRLGGDFNNLGFMIIGIFIAAWVISYIVYRAKKLDAIEVTTSA